MYTEEQYLMLSGIQHYCFCKRQWALIHIEQQWEENDRTAEGHILHERADNPTLRESRGDIFYSRAIPVASSLLGLSGILDVVMFRREEDGVVLPHRSGLWAPYVIEYKRGKEKNDLRDEVQLAAQVICLEEKLGVTIRKSFLYYFQTNRRVLIEMTDALRKEVLRLSKEMHQAYEQKETPKAEYFKNCPLCSLKDICMPRMTKKQKSVRRYLYGEDNEEIT